MIISKDLFLLGDQEYFRLPREDPNRAMARAVSRSESNKSQPLDLQFSDLTVALGKHPNKRVLLDGISGHVRPGEMLAVMGPSGSGKTTLLNALSGRLPDGMLEKGLIMLNGEKLNKKLRRKICYVLQHDIFFPGLTLKQTLRYTAMLRLPDELSYEEKMEHVNHIIKILDLQACQDTIIGDCMMRGLSGGEKKRVSVATELLTNPSVMLLDEPTSGLDSSTAHKLMSTLQQYARQEHKTVVITVHQPSSQIFYMFDRLLLLCNGQTAYFGKARKVVDFFEGIGLPIEPHYNPADFILEQIRGSAETREKIVKAYRESVVRQEAFPSRFITDVDANYMTSTSTLYENYLEGSQELNDAPVTEPSPQQVPECVCQTPNWLLPARLDKTPKQLETRVELDGHLANVYSRIVKEDDSSRPSSWSDGLSHSSQESHSQCWDKKFPTTFWTQFKVLSQRNFAEARPRMLSKLNAIQTIILALLAGLLWWQKERKEEHLSDIQGWMFFSTTYWMLFALFGALHSFPQERPVINKERQSGAYRLSAYYLAKMVGELPLTVTLPAAYHIISYGMLGYHSSGVFLALLGFLVLNTIVAQSAGLFIGAVCMDVQTSVTISALYTLACQLFGGYLATSIPPWMKWMRYASMVHYAFQNMQIVQFSWEPIRCAAVNSQFDICAQGGNETIIPTADILEASGGNELGLWGNTLVLLGFLVVFRVGGYLVLRYVRKPR